MTPREAKRQLNIRQWKAIIQDRIDSGLYVDDYCKQNNISRHAYFYWLRIIREEAIAPPAIASGQEPAGFVEIRLPGNVCPALPENGINSISAQEPAELLLTVNGITVHVTGGTSPELLSRTLEVIRNVK